MTVVMEISIDYFQNTSSELSVSRLRLDWGLRISIQYLYLAESYIPAVPQNIVFAGTLSQHPI